MPGHGVETREGFLSFPKVKFVEEVVYEVHTGKTKGAAFHPMIEHEFCVSVGKLSQKRDILQ